MNASAWLHPPAIPPTTPALNSVFSLLTITIGPDPEGPDSSVGDDGDDTVVAGSSVATMRVDTLGYIQKSACVQPRTKFAPTPIRHVAMYPGRADNGVHGKVPRQTEGAGNINTEPARDTSHDCKRSTNCKVLGSTMDTILRHCKEADKNLHQIKRSQTKLLCA